MFSDQKVTRYKHGFDETVFVPSPRIHGKQCLYVFNTYSPTRDRLGFYEKYGASVFFGKPGLYREFTGPVQALYAFFENFVPSKYRHCTVRFSTRLPHGYRLTESKKCLYRVSGNVHCRYIVGTLPVLLGIEPVSVGTGSYGVGYRSVSVSLHGHLGVLITPYYRQFNWSLKNFHLWVHEKK